jgi:large subunit ribosomal protein L29
VNASGLPCSARINDRDPGFGIESAIAPAASPCRRLVEPAEEDPAMSKPAELREQTDEQLELSLKEVQHNLFRLRLQSETERLEAPSEIVKAKREVARIKTILRLRQLERERSASTTMR